MRWGVSLLTSLGSLDKVILETHMQTLTGTDVGCFHSSAQESDKNRRGMGGCDLASVPHGELTNGQLMD